MSTTKVCIFDVNETLLNLDGLDSVFTKIFGSPQVRQIWFKSVLHHSLVLNLTHAYQEFSTVLDATLESVAVSQGIIIKPDDWDLFKKTLQSLPSHPDVQEGLQILQAAGYRLAALTNSGQQSSQILLEKAGLKDYFEMIMSTDSVKAFKPSMEPYHFAAKQMEVDLSRMWMIAAHAWDIHGASSVGAKTAFLNRPGASPCSLFHKPLISAEDLRQLAAQLIEKDEA